MIIDTHIKCSDPKEPLGNFWKIAGNKSITLDQVYDTTPETSVFTANSYYTTRD